MIKKWIQSLLKKEKRNDINLDIFQEAIIDYRQEGKELMFKLGEKYGLDIGIIEDYEKLISRSNKNIPRRESFQKDGIIVFTEENVDFIIKNIKSE